MYTHNMHICIDTCYTTRYTTSAATTLPRRARIIHITLNNIYNNDDDNDNNDLLL